MEGYQLSALQLHSSADEMGYSRQISQPQDDGFFHPLECDPTLQIEYAPLTIKKGKIELIS